MLTKVLIGEIICAIFIITNWNRIRKFKEQDVIWKFLIAYLIVGFICFGIMLIALVLGGSK